MKFLTIFFIGSFLLSASIAQARGEYDLSQAFSTIFKLDSTIGQESFGSKKTNLGNNFKISFSNDLIFTSTSSPRDFNGGAVIANGEIVLTHNVSREATLSALQQVVPQSIASTGSFGSLKYPFMPFCELRLVPTAGQRLRDATSIVFAERNDVLELELDKVYRFAKNDINDIKIEVLNVGGSFLTKSGTAIILECQAPSSGPMTSEEVIVTLRSIFGDIADIQ